MNFERLRPGDKRLVILVILLIAAGLSYTYVNYAAAFPQASLQLKDSRSEITELASGILRERATQLVRATTNNISVPANAEMILEGEVPPGERRLEGPFGDHFGHYCDAADFPVFRVRRITHRHNPIYPAAIVGKPLRPISR